MASNAADGHHGAASVALKVGAVNAAVGLIGTAVAFFIKNTAATGFAAGFILGGVNGLLLLRIARKGVSMRADKAARFVTASYSVRFVLTAVVLTLLIYRGFLTPWPLLSGLTTSIFATIGTLIGIARKEASQDA